MKSKLHFCNVHVSVGMKQIPKNTSFEQRAFLDDPRVFCMFFVFPRFHVFFDSKKWAPKGRIPSFGGSPKDQCQPAALYPLNLLLMWQGREPDGSLPTSSEQGPETTSPRHGPWIWSCAASAQNSHIAGNPSHATN